MLRIAAVVLTLVAGCRKPAPPAAPLPLPPPTTALVGAEQGTLAIAGRDVRYHVHFDRNALVQIHAIDGAVVALTRTGNLLRLDPDTLALDREVVVTPAVDCIGGDGHTLFAGHADGTISRVDPATLALEPFARMPMPPQWIGRRGDAVYVVTRAELARFGSDGAVRPMPARSMEMPELPARPGVWRFDRNGRLWWGIDAGEWGGAAGWVDVDTGASGVVEDLDDPVLGLAEVGDAMWAYGGMIHMGYTYGFVAAIAGDAARTLWDHDGLPVTWVGDAGDRVRVAIWGEVHDVDRALADWKPVAALEARYMTGHPTSIGATPAVRDVAEVGDDFLIATLIDGIFRLRGTTIEPRAIAGDPIPPLTPPVVEPEPPEPDAEVFVNVDGEAWAARHGKLWRRSGETWVWTGEYEGSLGMLEPIRGPAPRGLLVDRWYGGLWWQRDDTLERAVPEDSGAIDDALADDHGVLIAARDAGVRRFDPATGKLERAEVTVDAEVRALAYDDRGRLWIGGDGLWLVDEAGALLDLASLPGVGGRLVDRMVADPDVPDGVRFTLWDGGLVTVAVE